MEAQLVMWRAFYVEAQLVMWMAFYVDKHYFKLSQPCGKTFYVKVTHARVTFYVDDIITSAVSHVMCTANHIW